MSAPISSFRRTLARLATPFARLAVVSCVACDPGGTKVSSAAPSATPPTPAAATTPASEGQTGCRFQRPQLWTAGRTQWLGGCRQGFADGSGVIVNTGEGAEPERFYGRLEGGSPSIGVVHTAGGFVAGRWRNGSLGAALPDDMAQRNVLIEAFRVAADAATATSKLLLDKGDGAGSSFYSTQARLLGDQMD